MTQSALETQLRSHIDALCQEPRTPKSPGYFKAQEYLRKCIRDIGLEPKEHNFDVWGLDGCTNIYAESDPKSNSPVVLIGAHYESRDISGVAADDNASAVAVAFETARKLLGKTNFVLVFFDMEEIYKFVWQDLQGSKAFAKTYSRQIDRVLIMDLVGGAIAPHFEKIYLQFGNALPSLKSPEIEFLHLPMLIVEPVGSIGARSDYNAFRKAGIPFTFISSGTPWYYHTPFDSPEVLIYPKMIALTETLSNALVNKKDFAPKDGNLESFISFLQAFTKTKVLNHPLIEKLLKENRLPSRLEMIRLYKHILPTLRKYKADLWKMN